MPRGVVYVWLDSLSHAVRWFRLAVIGLAGVVLLALVITVAPVPQPAAAEPTPTPAPPAGGEGWVQPTGEGVVRPDWVSASVTARASGQRVEVLSQRTEAKRVWVQPSGLVESETFGGPVRFKDPAAAAADGWRDIDTALQANADGSVSPAAASGKVILSGGGSSEVLVTSADAAGRSIQVGSGLPGVALPKPSLDGATATYADVVDGVDLRVEVRRTGFEQLWVIKDQAGLDRFLAARASGATVSLSGPLTLAKLAAAPQRDGSVKFTDDKDRPVGKLKTPAMWDAATDPTTGEPLNVKRIAFAVSAAGKDLSPNDPAVTGKLNLTVEADQAWLADPARKFPIIIDPTYEQGSSAVTFDTFVQDGDTTDRSADPELRLGVDGAGKVARSYLNIDAGAVVGRTIMSGSLALWGGWSASCTATPWSAYTAGMAGATTRWTAQPTIGAKYATSTATKGSTGCPAGEVSIEMKAQLQAWAAAGSVTQGLLLRADNEADTAAFKKFDSSEGAHPPRLTWTSNRAPDAMGRPTPGDAVSYMPSGSSQAYLYTADRKPTMSAVVSDPDGDTVQARFDTSTSIGGPVVSTCTSPATASGATASCELATDLAADGRYFIHARGRDPHGAWGPLVNTTQSQEVRIAATAPAAPVVSCPAPYTNGSWQTAAPAADVSCTITAVGTGYSAPSKIGFSVDGNPQYTFVAIPQSNDPAVAKVTVTVPRTVGGHSIRAWAYGPAGLGAASSFYVGWGDGALLKRPHPATPRITTTDKVEMNAAAKGQASPVPTAKTQWRVSGTTSTTAWKDAPTGNPLTVAQVGGQSQASGMFDTTTIVGQADNAGVTVPARMPTLIDVRVCITLSTGVKCSSHATVLRVPHAFGDGFPTAEAGPGQVALWTGELQVDDADAELATPGGSLSVSRSHSSFAGTPAPQNKVFGPGWTASFDDDAGAGGAELYDGTPVDGTLAVLTADGEALVFTTPTGARRTTTTVPIGLYKPADRDTATAGATLNVSGSGVSTIAELKGDDGVVTKFQVTAAPGTGSATFRTVEVREPASAGKTTYSYDASNRVTGIVAPLPDGVTSCVPGTKTLGCRVLRINYATATTATSTTPGDFINQVKSIVAQVNTDATDRILAEYKYDSTGRLVQATDARAGLTTTYGWTGSGTTLRLATLTPPGLAAYTFSYTSNKLATVTRPNSASAGGGTAQLAAYVYGVPTSGTGLPNLPTAASAWQQAKTPTWGAAVFGPDRPITGITPAAVTDPEWWKRAALSYTDPDGWTVNTAGWGAGDWQYTATDYDATGNIVRAFDQRGTRAVLDGAVGAGGASRYATLTTYNPDILSGGTVVTPAGTLITDTYSPVRQAVAADGSSKMLRSHTSTVYDQSAPNSGINPATGQPYRLPTTVTTTAELEDGTPDQTLSLTFVGYAALETGDTTGWELGQATSSTIDMDDNGSINAGDITSRTRYDAKGRVIENRQPKSDGNDAGTRTTSYYTAAAGGACGSKPEYAGWVCKVGPKAQPSGQTMPVTTTTSYSWDGQTATETDTSGTVTRTTTVSFDAKDRPATSSTAVTGLSGSTAVPAVTTSYDNTTGLTTGTSSSAGSTGMTYDNWGRQLTYTNTPAGQTADTATTTYNPLGQVISVVDNNGQTSYTYDGTDALGRAETRGLATEVKVKITGGTEYSTTGAYDHAGALTVEKLPGKIIRRTTLDTTGQQTGLTYNGQAVDAGTGQFVDDQPWLGWTTASNTQGQTVREWTPGGAGYTGGLGATAVAADTSYIYDKAGRLTRVQDRITNNPGGSYTPGCNTRTYTFDANGNRTGQNSIAPDTNGDCQITGGSPITRAYDAADRPATGANGNGTYTYDQLGRQTTIPAADAPKPTNGDLTLGYYDTDAARTITQNELTTSFTLDGANRRLTQTETGTTLTRRYTDSGDSPTWSVDVTGSSATTTRYAEFLNSDLGLTLTTATAGTTAELALATPRGDTAATIALPLGATGPNGSGATSINTWNRYDEYGQPAQPFTMTAGGTTGIGYGWLGAKHRSTVGAVGTILMGARVYAPSTGTFTSTDPVFGGNKTSFAYPIDPVNNQDTTGEFFCNINAGMPHPSTHSAWAGRSEINAIAEVRCGYNPRGTIYMKAKLQKRIRGRWVTQRTVNTTKRRTPTYVKKSRTIPCKPGTYRLIVKAKAAGPRGQRAIWSPLWAVSFIKTISARDCNPGAGGGGGGGGGGSW